MQTVGHLVFADGTRFAGKVFGAMRSTVGEVVFMTGMTGYQEVLSDPSYRGQIVVMTSAHIGNTGVNDLDNEAHKPFLSGFVVRELARRVSNYRSEQELHDYLLQHDIAGIAAIDTRSVTRHVRDHGAQMAAIGSEDIATLHDRAKAAAPMQGQDLAREVSTPEPYVWSEAFGEWSVSATQATASQALPSVNSTAKEGDRREPPWHVVAIDFGIKRSILRCLVEGGCRVTVVPASMPASAIEALRPDGVFLSNGPGDPAAVNYGIETVRALLGKKPIFGICLGHQILSTALGAKTYKLKFGHHGLNQPVQDRSTGRVEITSQNHGFAVDIDSLPKGCELTHINLNDGTCEGVAQPYAKAFGIQYHPEAGAGPHDSRHLFQRFIDNIRASA